MILKMKNLLLVRVEQQLQLLQVKVTLVVKQVTLLMVLSLVQKI